MKILLLLLGFILSSAEAAWNTQHEEGWHWYQEPLEVEKDVSKNPLKTSVDPLLEVAIEREQLERLRAEAILRPTEDSVHAYIQKQTWASNQADRFSQVWDAVLRLHPELDYTVKYPTVQFARHIYLDQEKLKVQKAIEAFKEQYGFFFFLRGDCPYCHAVAPMIKEVSLKHGISVTAVSLDGGTLAEYANVLPDNGIAKQMGVYQVPAIFAVNPGKHEWFPIVTGPISATDLEERILAIAEYLAFQSGEENHAKAVYP